MADNVIANSDRLFLPDGKHITTLVDSYYIVGTGESTYQTLEFTLNEARDSFILDSGSWEDNQDDVITTESTDGDGTVLFNSATIFNTFENNRVFVKEGGLVVKHNGYTEYTVSYSADHSKMLSSDLSTSEFIALLIDESYLLYNSDELYYDYLITKGYGGVL